MEDKVLEQALKEKLSHLTIDGAREFWNEISEYLDSMVGRCDVELRKASTMDDVRKAQILRDTCLRLKGLPDRMAISLRDQLAADSSGVKKEELDALNFFGQVP